MQEAFPEDRPNEPGADEITYAELTNDPSIALAFRNRMINFFEEKACGDEAGSRAYRAVPLGLIALSVGSGAVASAFRREKDLVRKAMRDVQKQAKRSGFSRCTIHSRRYLPPYPRRHGHRHECDRWTVGWRGRRLRGVCPSRSDAGRDRGTV